MKRIEPGMLVRLVDGPAFEANRDYIGRTGRVAEVRNGGRSCYIPSLPGRLKNGLWGIEVCEPINPDNESSSWEEVQKITKWNPTETRHETTC